MNPPNNRGVSKRERAKDMMRRMLSSSYLTRSEVELLVQEFNDKKSTIMERLLLIEIIQDSMLLNEGDDNDGIDLLTLDYEETMRGHVKVVMDEWDEMMHLYEREAKQSKSKVSEDDLEVHRALLLQIRDHIYTINDEDVTGIPNELGAHLKKTESMAEKNPASKAYIDHSDTCKTRKMPEPKRHQKQKREKAEMETTEYDKKSMDDKIKRMNEKLTKYKTQSPEVEIASKKSITKSLSSKMLFISGSNKKLMKLNKSLSVKKFGMKNTNQQGIDDTIDTAPYM